MLTNSSDGSMRCEAKALFLGVTFCQQGVCNYTCVVCKIIGTKLIPDVGFILTFSFSFLTHCYSRLIRMMKISWGGNYTNNIIMMNKTKGVNIYRLCRNLNPGPLSLKLSALALDIIHEFGIYDPQIWQHRNPINSSLLSYQDFFWLVYVTVEMFYKWNIKLIR